MNRQKKYSSEEISCLHKDILRERKELYRNSFMVLDLITIDGTLYSVMSLFCKKENATVYEKLKAFI